MRFRPCIDIHNGQVKQIIGGSLQDTGDTAKENFVSTKPASYYANLYREKALKGGHVILLNAGDSPYYAETRRQALEALETYPGGLQVGGGITAENAPFYIEQGASHVIVSSYVFKGGRILENRLHGLVEAVGKEKLVLDLSCRKKDGIYYIMTDRWQTWTDIPVNETTLNQLAGNCDEFLIHAVDVEGKSGGIEADLVENLAKWSSIPVTYAGGIHSMEDIRFIREKGCGKVDYTIGTALDLFGGDLSFEEVVAMSEKE
ncbi:MAG: phosphoribosylformimino-5-aminoimidazole carboxamide ribotide isomerase [Lachnospiraceae bacterium]|nr:phosphoribosylformimino-5-aminoimidazole carboxamide ribotide isomerase [Lachnospiraceae bacterium]